MIKAFIVACVMCVAALTPVSAGQLHGQSYGMAHGVFSTTSWGHGTFIANKTGNHITGTYHSRSWGFGGNFVGHYKDKSHFFGRLMGTPSQLPIVRFAGIQNGRTVHGTLSIGGWFWGIFNR